MVLESRAGCGTGCLIEADHHCGLGRMLTKHMTRIREKFEKIDRDFNAIETVRGIGYRLKKI